MQLGMNRFPRRRLLRGTIRRLLFGFTQLATAQSQLH